MIKWGLKVIGEQKQKLQIKSMAAKESCDLSYKIFSVNAKAKI
jgi:hypothetical protein